MINYVTSSQGYAQSVAKRFFIVFVIAAILLGGTATTHYYVVTKTERIERETSELLNVELGKTAIASDLGNVMSDLMFLAKHNEQQGLFETGEPESREMLATEFLTFIKQKGIYDQIRFIDETGREIVRVNYNRGKPLIVPEHQLQNKGGRYYFKNTWALGRDNVYISPLDLNIEHGRIEQPLKPMLRFCAPVFDRSGEKKGILVLNYLGEKLIVGFRQAAANISDHVMLLNAEGFWLSSPQREDEWGFMYNNDSTFQKAYPDAWQRIQAGDSGQFYNNEGLFSFTTVYPILYSAIKRETLVIDKNYYWKAVAHISPQRLANAPRFLRRHATLYAVMLALMAIASLLFARASVRHLRATTQIEFERQFRNVLEKKVEERTLELQHTQIEKERVVDQLIQAEKVAAIGMMASGIGHEINNPLYAILGTAEAIRDEKDIDRSREYGRDIINYSKHIAEIVRNLSGYIRPSSGHDVEPIDVNEKLSDAVAMAKRSLLCNHVEIREDFAQVPVISAKPEELQQAFFNVIRNGIQAVKGKGKVEISTRREGSRIVVRIRDTGVGISKEHLGKIYDPFFTTKGPDEGEGLGLYVVQQIVKKYAGTITFESEEGKGTVCTIQFPIGEEHLKEVLK